MTKIRELSEDLDAALFDAWDRGFRPVGIHLKSADLDCLKRETRNPDLQQGQGDIFYRGILLIEAENGRSQLIARRPARDLRRPSMLVVEIV